MYSVEVQICTVQSTVLRYRYVQYSVQRRGTYMYNIVYRYRYVQYSVEVQICTIRVHRTGPDMNSVEGQICTVQ